MKSIILSVAFASALVLGASCQKQEFTDIICGDMPPFPGEACTITTWMQDRPAAQASLLGDWRWLQTRYPTRGVLPENTRVETPQSIGKNRTYRFTTDRYIILENGEVMQDLPYDLKFQGEGTNTVDPVLLLRAYRSAAADAPASVLHLDSGLSCLELVNSYGDAGGDVSLKRIEKGE